MGSNGKLFIREDITDWRDETYREESIIESDSDILECLRQGKPTSQIARSTIVSRALGKAPDDIIRPNRLLILTGAMADISSKAHGERMTVSGCSVPAMIGRPAEAEQEPEDDAEPPAPGPSYASAISETGQRYARRYLSNIVTGHIFNRLAQLHAAGVDVRQEADALKMRIDEIVGRLANNGV